MVVALPEDVLFGTACVADAPPVRVARAAPTEEDLAELRIRLRGTAAAADRGWHRLDGRCLCRPGALQEAIGLPVAALSAGRTRSTTVTVIHVGQLASACPPRSWPSMYAADLLLVLGARLGEPPRPATPSSKAPARARPCPHLAWTRTNSDGPTRPLQPINASVVTVPWPLAADPDAPPAGLTETQRRLPGPPTPPTVTCTTSAIDGVDFSQVMVCWMRNLPDDAVVANGAGNYTVAPLLSATAGRPPSWPRPMVRWATACLPPSPPLRHPDRTVVSVAGDGCLL